jgi:methyl-accepting chemotaxis protein
MLQDESEVLESNESYVLQRQTDRQLGTEYMVLWGTLEDGNIIMIRSALESIRESVAISNNFLFVGGIVSVLISVIIGWFVTKYITRPIESLTQLSIRMSSPDITKSMFWENALIPCRRHWKRRS